MTRILSAILLLASILITMPSVSSGQNVDLVTLPNRDTVQLTIYNSEDLTLARETRFVTLKKGANRLQFSWAGTLIDPTSVQMRPLANADEIDVVDTVYLGQKPQHLIWNIRSDIEGQVPVEVTYFTSGLTWKMDYTAIVNAEEEKMQFRGFVRVFNNSGEEYDNAQIRMIVGKINLVEKIATLAAAKGISVPKPGESRFRDMRREAVKDLYSKAGGFGGGGGPAANAKKIVKEGVSEYFMFSVDGHETIRNGWSKRMRAVKADDVDFKIVYRMRAYQYGPRPVRFFTWKNDSEHNLGDSPLPNGIVRVFRENGRDGLGFLGQQSLNYVPVQADIEVNLGHDDLVVYERRVTDTRRGEFSFDRNRNVNGWQQTQNWLDTIRNYRAKPITFELRLLLPGDVHFRTDQQASLFDFRTVQTEIQVDANDSRSLKYTVTTNNGANVKQSRIRLN